MNRRGFMGGLAALLGFGSLAKSDDKKQPDCEGLPEEVLEYAKRVWRGYGLARPNPVMDEDQFCRALASDLWLVGTALVWKVPNKLGRLLEVHLLPIHLTYPVAGDFAHPHGSYRVADSVLGTVADARYVDRFLWPVPLASVPCSPEEVLKRIREICGLENRGGLVVVDTSRI